MKYFFSSKLVSFISYFKIFQHPRICSISRMILSSVWVTIDGVWIGELIYWPLTHTARNYKQLKCHTNLHNSQVTTAPAKLFPACRVFTSPSLATASKSGDSSASRAQVLFPQNPVHNWLGRPSSLPSNASARTTQKNPVSNSTSNVTSRFVAVESLRRNGPGISVHFAIVA
jgi:hypothetical protein